MRVGACESEEVEVRRDACDGRRVCEGGDGGRVCESEGCTWGGKCDCEQCTPLLSKTNSYVRVFSAPLVTNHLQFEAKVVV